MSIRPLHKQAGFGLIEAMVAFVVLAIGLLGIATMQNRALTNSSVAYIQSQAMFLAQDIVERMRANRLALPSYQTSFTDPAPATVDCASTDCAPTAIATADLAEWKQQVTSMLPSGQADITVSGASQNEIAVIIRFDGARDTADMHNYTLRTQI